MERLYGCVGVFVHCEDGAAGATFGVFVVEGGVIDEFVVAVAKWILCGDVWFP